MLTAASALALFLMLALASVVFFIAKRFSLPFTVLLTFVGILLVPLTQVELFSFLREFQLTPELLFYILLPTLLFESAYAMNIRRIVDDLKPILLLSVVGYLISAFAIGGALWFLFDCINFPVPFIITLLFGALISATDPVAVLALFKEFGAPRRLTLIFEGESLLNDATALALFVIVLSFAEAGLTSSSLALGAVTFTTMLIGGTILGFIVAAVFIKLMELFRKNEIVAITIMIVLAHSTFLIAELLNHEFAHAGWGALQFSPIIATTAASIVMGNYGRFKLLPSAEEFIEKFWSQFAFMANSLVFILVGFLFASIPQGAEALALPTILAVLTVAGARALSIYGTVIPFNLLNPAERIPLAWQHLLSWGSLRGALAVMLVLLVPPDLTVPGWSLSLSVQQFLLVITVACIFVTLFLKAPLIRLLMERLSVGTLTPLEVAAERHARSIIIASTIQKLKTFAEKKYVPESIASRLIAEHELERSSLVGSGSSTTTLDPELSEKVLNLYVIGLELEVLKELMTFDEINERVFKRVYGKLTIQSEDIEAGLPLSLSKVRDHRDVFENAAEWLRALVTSPESRREDARQDYLYYRTQGLLARKVLKELSRISTEFNPPPFDLPLINTVRERYEGFLKNAEDCKRNVATAHPELVETLDIILAHRSVYRVVERQVEMLRERRMLTPKLYIALRDSYEKEAMMEETVTRAALHAAQKTETKKH